MSALRRALDDAFEDRARALRGEVLAHDTLHRVDRCARCGLLARRVALLVDGPGGDDPGAIAEWTESRRAQLPFVDAGCECVEAPAATLVALSYVRGCAGQGEECAREGYDDGGVWRWRWRRRALDGAPREVELGELPAVGRRAQWRGALDAAAAGEVVLRALEEGLWAFAGPREETLEARVKSLVGACGRGLLLPLKLLVWRPVVPRDEAWTAWASAHATSIERGDLRAGAVIDVAVLRGLVRVAAARVGVDLDEGDDRAVVLRRGELSRAVDLERLALSIALRGDGLAHGAARAVNDALALLASAADAAASARALRPDVRFTVEGWSLRPERGDGSVGPAIALPETATPTEREREVFERAVRFGCDVLPPWSDPSRVCPCGAPACFVARLLPHARAVDAAERAPMVLAAWPPEAPRAVLAAGLGCELHTWFPSAETLAAQGFTLESIATRVRADAPLATLAFTARCVEEGEKKALVVRGHHVSSAMVDDHGVSALHRACDAPLQGPVVGALAVGAGAVILYEQGWERDALDRLLDAVAAEAGVRDGADALLVSRDARVDALPRGRMIREEAPR